MLIPGIYSTKDQHILRNFPCRRIAELVIKAVNVVGIVCFMRLIDTNGINILDLEFVEGMKNDKVWDTASSYFINKMTKLVMEGNGV